MYKIFFALSAASYIFYFLSKKREEKLLEKAAKQALFNKAMHYFQSVIDRTNPGINSGSPIPNYTRESYYDIVREFGREDIIIKAEYVQKYLYNCSSCGSVTDVKKSESNHRSDTKSYMTNGRITKDGDYDQRYNTEFSHYTIYFFDAVCENCNQDFIVKLNERDYSSRSNLNV